ncbi:MAG: glycosyl hydrolase family 5 [Ruminococcus sp.]|nr:glycosyl hydrolase family 5 [Ruminococcus sp.]
MNFRKILAILSCAVMCISAVSCKSEKENSSSEISSSSSEASSSESSGENSEDSDESSEEDSESSDADTESGDVSVTVELNSSWESGGSKTYDYTVTLKNNTDKPVTDWVVTLPAGDGKVGSAWSSKYTEKDGILTVTPESYNSTIEAGKTVEFGMQIAGGTGIDTSAVTVSASEGSVSADVQSQNNQNSNNNNNFENSNSSQQGGNDKIESSAAKDVPEPSTDDWLSTDGSKIVDSEGNEVWLTGVNWFGYNTGTNCFDGLWACDLDASLASIADHGFNLLRIPISTELVNNWEDGEYPEANYNNATNAYLNGMNSLEIFDHVIGQCRANGIKIMIDFHCAKTDSMGHMKPMWYDGDVTVEDFYRGLEWIADRYKNDDTIVAIDLENEPHGKHNETPRAKWDDSTDEDNWKYVAEEASKKVLGKNPNLLIMVEGIEIYPKDIKSNGDFASTNEDDYLYNWWGGNLRGVADNPVDLGKYQNKLVYSPHDYGPSVYEQPWFEGGYDYESLQEDCWYDNWFYIQDEDIAPLLIGEWGGFMTEPNLTWMTYLRKYIKENKINHTFWCFNSNSGDTGGLVLGDFITWDDEKYEFVKEVLWQKDGKFVGLDHEIPLGENGISLSEMY